MQCWYDVEALSVAKPTCAVHWQQTCCQCGPVGVSLFPVCDVIFFFFFYMLWVGGVAGGKLQLHIARRNRPCAAELAPHYEVRTLQNARKRTRLQVLRVNRGQFPAPPPRRGLLLILISVPSIHHSAASLFSFSPPPPKGDEVPQLLWESA